MRTISLDNYNSGIEMTDATDNTISGNTIRNNGHDPIAGYASSGAEGIAGITLSEGSEYNTISGNFITLNKANGIFIYDANNNLIYNNYFSNDRNVQTDGMSTNTWNLPTPIPAPAGGNIIGGTNLAGNYWADPDGTGFSQTALYDRGDGIVDHAYVIDAHNSDQFPLGGLPRPAPGSSGRLITAGNNHPRVTIRFEICVK